MKFGPEVGEESTESIWQGGQKSAAGTRSWIQVDQSALWQVDIGDVSPPLWSAAIYWGFICQKWKNLHLEQPLCLLLQGSLEQCFNVHGESKLIMGYSETFSGSVNALYLGEKGG